MSTTRQEHLDWCKKRALEYVDAGDLQQALTSFASDVRTTHPELPSGEIQFALHVDGAESWSWADICNNGAVPTPGVNPWNEKQAVSVPCGNCGVVHEPDEIDCPG